MEFKPKEEVYYVSRNKIYNSKVQMILPRKNYHLYHLENGDNLKIENMFKSQKELIRDLTLNIKS